MGGVFHMISTWFANSTFITKSSISKSLCFPVFLLGSARILLWSFSWILIFSALSLVHFAMIAFYLLRPPEMLQISLSFRSSLWFKIFVRDYGPTLCCNIPKPDEQPSIVHYSLGVQHQQQSRIQAQIRFETVSSATIVLRWVLSSFPAYWMYSSAHKSFVFYLNIDIQGRVSEEEFRSANTFKNGAITHTKTRIYTQASPLAEYVWLKKWIQRTMQNNTIFIEKSERRFL